MLTMPIPEYLHEILDDVRDTTSGELADYIPELKSADPNPLAVALCTVNGHIYSAGDDDIEFTMQSISKPFAYALALQECGFDEVSASVALEPSGEAFNELSLDGENRPMNPMINAGAIAINQLINGTTEDGGDVQQALDDFFAQNIEGNYIESTDLETETDTTTESGEETTIGSSDEETTVGSSDENSAE